MRLHNQGLLLVRGGARRHLFSSTPAVIVPATNVDPPSIDQDTLIVGAAPTWYVGFWNGSNPITYASNLYADGALIAGGPYASGEYTLQAAEAGKIISVGIVATNAAGSSEEVMSAGVGPVLAATELVPLSLSSTNWTIGTPASGTIIGATAGSTLTLSGAPSGLSIDSAARTWDWDGTGTVTPDGSFVLTEDEAGASNSPNDTTISYSIAAAADATAPTLSSATDTATGPTSASLGVTTDEGNGTLYWFVSTSATPPSAADLKAGVGAAAFGSQLVTTTGAKSANATGLAISTAYFSYFLHRDAAGNESAIEPGDGFATTADTPPSYDAALTPPEVSLAVPADQFPPSFALDWFGGVLQDGDRVVAEWSTTADFAVIAGTASAVADAAAEAAGELVFDFSAIVDPFFYQFRRERDRVGGGYDYGDWSSPILHGDATAPTITSSATQSAVFFSLTADDTVTWSIIGGADAAKWQISGSTLELIDTTGVTQSVHSVTVRATNLATLTSDQTITITLDLAPSFTPAFGSQASATASTDYEGATSTIGGLTTGLTVPVSVTGGSYSKNGGAYTTSAGEVGNGDTVKAKGTASGTPGGETDVAVTAGATTETFTITTGASLPTGSVLRLEADDLTTLFQSNAGSTAVAADGDPVGYWGDKSGAGFHLTSAANDTTRPTFHTSGGKSWITFDGVNDFLRRLASLGLYASASGCTVGVAMRSATPTAASQTAISAGSTSSPNPRYNPLMAPTGSAFTRASSQVRNDANTDTLANTTSRADGAFSATPKTIIFTDDLSSHAIYLDNALSPQSPDAYTRSGTLTLNTFGIGAQAKATPSNWFPMEVVAIIIYPSVLNSTDRAALHTYLASKL